MMSPHPPLLLQVLVLPPLLPCCLKEDEKAPQRREI